MNAPDHPPRHGHGTAPRVTEEEAARLLEVGLSGPGTRPRADVTVPSATELAARFPDLEILELLGQGGMGVVYRARQRKLDRLVALKVLPRELSEDPAFAERFTREARALAKLNHPHVVGVYEVGEKQGLHYLLMEYVDGVTLRQLMQGGSLSPRDALSIVPQICDALQYAHSQGVVHRDVKPENILLDRKGRVQVADFGLAKLADRGPGDFTLTGTGQVMGTLHYMAPEQYKTPADVDHRADIFSLGVVFYEMLTGELPVGNFQKPSQAADLDARLDQIVLRALERQREQRYQSASEVEADVQTVLRGPAARPARRPFQRMHERHARGRETREGAARGLPVSAFTTWAWWIALAAAPLGFATWGFIFEFARVDGSYLGTVIGGLLGVGLGGFALVLVIVGLVRTSRRRGELGGRRRALTLLVLLGILIPGVTLHLAYESERMRTQKRAQMQWEAERRLRRPVAVPGTYIEVKGQAPGSDPWPIRNAVLETWNEYVGFMRRGDATPASALKQAFYAADEATKFATDSDFVMRERAKNGVFGLGAMGKGHLPAPPWEFELRQVVVDRWEQEAEVRAWHKGPDRVYRLVFKLKRSNGRWVFAQEPPEIFPKTWSAEDGG